MTNISYLITSFLSYELNKQIISLRNNLGITPFKGGNAKDEFITKNIAHLTIKRPFFLRSSASEDDLVTRLASDSFPKIDLEAKDFTIFSTKDNGNVLVALIFYNNELMGLHKDIYSKLQSITTNKHSSFENEEYTPHITIVYNLLDANQAAATTLLEKMLPFRFTLEQINLLKTKPGVANTRTLLKKYYAN